MASLLEKEIRQTGNSFKQAVNHYLRLGLMASNQKKTKPFEVKLRPRHNMRRPDAGWKACCQERLQWGCRGRQWAPFCGL